MLFRISKLEKALRENPGMPLFARVADEYLRRGRVAPALALCQEGCERFPDYPTGFLLLARCCEARGNFEEARNALDRALRLDPENPAAFAALSAAWERLGEINLALQCMRQAAFLEPYSGNLKREAERLRRRSAAAPLVLPPAPKAVAGSVVRDELNAEEGRQEAEAAEREPSPAVGYGQTGMFYLVSEPEPEEMEADAGTGELPEAALPAAEEAGRGSEPAPPHETGPGRPVARLSGREDHELTGLLSEIRTAGDGAPEPTVADAAGEAHNAPVPTATLAELYIQQGSAGKGIDIYRDLLRLHPGDDAIRGRLAVLEAASSPERPPDHTTRGENG